MRFAAVALLLFALGCSSKTVVVHELTPLQEYALAKELKLSEHESLKRMEGLLDDDPEKLALVAKAQERFDRAQLQCEIAEKRFIESLPKK